MIGKCKGHYIPNKKHGNNLDSKNYYVDGKQSILRGRGRQRWNKWHRLPSTFNFSLKSFHFVVNKMSAELFKIMSKCNFKEMNPKYYIIKQCDF